MTGMEIVTVPHTGEYLDLPNETDSKLAEVLTEVRDLESRLRELKAGIQDEFHRRMDKSRLYTLHLPGGMKVTGQSDALKSVWDGAELERVLEEMAAGGEIEADVIGRTVEELPVVYKVDARGVAALLKSPTLAPRIEACRRLVAPEGRRISVSRS